MKTLFVNESSSGGGGVESVTGHLVDNTDPLNPVLIQRASFIATNANATDISITTSSTTPSFFGPLMDNLSSGISLVDATTGTLRNDTGRTISMTGTINFNPDKGGGGTTQLNIVSERATTLGGPWVGNLESKRTVEISNNSESFATKLSLIIDWEPNQLLRFRGWINGGSLDFVVSSVSAIGQTFVSPSIAWELTEQ